MAITHNLGFPRIGPRRELKFALESYWRGDSDASALQAVAAEVRADSRQRQAELDWQPVGDFSLYDQVLDTSFLLGHIPARFQGGEFVELDRYFRMARGRSVPAAGGGGVAAGEMTKWFNTNYHYIVPEFDQGTTFHLHAGALRAQVAEARAAGCSVKPVILGPLSYLWLGKSTDGVERLELLDALLPVYAELLAALHADGAEWVQIDEPLLVQDLPGKWQLALRRAYASFTGPRPQILLTSYFGVLGDNQSLALSLPVEGVHIDAVAGRAEADAVVAACPADKVLSLGVIDGRNVWKTDLNALLDWLEPIAQSRGDSLWIAPSCSLLHVPVDLAQEDQLDPEVADWLAFAVQKLGELNVLGTALNKGRDAVRAALDDNARALHARRQSQRVSHPAVRARVAQLPATAGERNSPYAERATRQQELLQLPAFPTTTIGSFPQTADIRAARRQHKAGKLSDAAYTTRMRDEIKHCIRTQEELGLDVLVHGEAERNDMVEYFGEQLEGYVFSRFGWVQSYGSRCVKPPILFGDIQRPAPMTVEWATYAQSLSDKPVKGMLTGPVTILNWSFVRDDQPRAETCRQLAVAIRDEVQDLAAAGIRIIQIDEAALREGLPLRHSDWAAYLRWAVDSFRIAANGVGDETQIHTHMCYSEFNDIIADIARMDADVITIETSRSHMELLNAFQGFEYPNAIGPGVYDIHSPNVPTAEAIVALMQEARERISAERLWVNPDCGLKTRRWEEVKPALQHMVDAALQLRSDISEAA